MSEHAVVIAGGGPTGLMLAGELALAGVDVVIVERRAGQNLDGTRARGLHARTIEVLDQRGVADRFVSAGRQRPFVGYASGSLDISDFPTRHNYLLGLWQGDFERLLGDWVIGELGVPILRRCELVGFAQDDTGVDVELSSGKSRHARRGWWHRPRRPGEGRRAASGRPGRVAPRSNPRAHPRGPPRGARRRLRDGLRGAQPRQRDLTREPPRHLPR
jgi:choline dehydrogenase-like flavoprotein